VIRTVVVAGCATGILLALASGPRVLLGINVIAAAGSLFIASQLAGIYRDPADPITLLSPVTGTWYVVQGGRAELVNNHRAALMQDDALDIVQVVHGATHTGNGHNVADYYCYGQPLRSPAAGRVVTVQAGLPDQRIGSTDRDHLPGNHVVIDIGGGRYVAFGHLRPGTITVAVGDRVRAGQQIAEIGNSGNSSEPHLHVQIQNTPQFDVETPAAGTRTYPWLLRHVTLTRSGHASHPSTADLRRGDWFVSTTS
jgi:murein DD-endopeptidase MepM/ murein hydrolase activator NlpD